jgi:anion-transporting  ArsA/GET3 family ATPase
VRASRLAIVTGKGGVGKTTVAAALARAALQSGKRTLLVEVATPGRLAYILGEKALPTVPLEIRKRLYAVALDEDRALEALVRRLLPLRLLSRRLLGSETFRVVAAAVPGIREAALLASVIGWLEEVDGLRRPRYDLVVLDAPATGHSVPLLSTPRTLSGLASIGPLGEILRRTMEWLSDPERSTALVVAIPEEWAIAEALELYASLRDVLDLPLARPVLNAVFPRRFSQKDAELLERADVERSIDPHLLAAARYFNRRRSAVQPHVKALRDATAARPIELPFVFSATMTWDDLDPLAEVLGACAGAVG